MKKSKKKVKNEEKMNKVKENETAKTKKTYVPPTVTMTRVHLEEGVATVASPLNDNRNSITKKDE